MKGLLIKDFSVLTRQMRIFLVMIVVFSILPGSYMVTFAVIYAAMLPYTSLAYDERSKWDQLAAVMPYSRRDLVLSKYILGWIFTGGAALLAMAARLIEGRFMDQAGSPSAVALAFCIGIIMIALTLPPMIRFGVEKGRLFFVLMIAVVGCGAAGLVNNAMEHQITGLVSSLSLALPLAAAGLTVISVPLSIRLYDRRRG
jgi:hypothetical protein